MADFERVLRRSLDGLSERSIETRERLYVTAIAAVETQLQGMKPTPSGAMIRKQLMNLKDAIIVIEAEFGHDLAKVLAERAINRERAASLQRNAITWVVRFVPADLAADFLFNLEELHLQWIVQLGEHAAKETMHRECINFVCRYQINSVLSFAARLRQIIFRAN